MTMDAAAFGSTQVKQVEPSPVLQGLDLPDQQVQQGAAAAAGVAASEPTLLVTPVWKLYQSRPGASS